MVKGCSKRWTSTERAWTRSRRLLLSTRTRLPPQLHIAHRMPTTHPLGTVFWRPLQTNSKIKMCLQTLVSLRHAATQVYRTRLQRRLPLCRRLLENVLMHLLRARHRAPCRLHLPSRRNNLLFRATCGTVREPGYRCLLTERAWTLNTRRRGPLLRVSHATKIEPRTYLVFPRQ